MMTYIADDNIIFENKIKIFKIRFKVLKKGSILNNLLNFFKNFSLEAELSKSGFLAICCDKPENLSTALQKLQDTRFAGGTRVKANYIIQQETAFCKKQANDAPVLDDNWVKIK